MKKPIFALIPSGFKASKLYTPIPMDGGGDFITTRASVANRVNKEGYIEEVAANVPRLDYKDGNKLSDCPSLLLESERTNLMPYSEDWSLGWIVQDLTTTPNSKIAPNGKVDATKLERTVTTTSYTSDSFTKAASAITYTSSIFVKQGNTPYFAFRTQGLYPARVDLRFNFDTKEIYYTNLVTFTDLSYKVEEYPNGWFRLSWTYTTDNHTLLAGVVMSPRALDGNIDSVDLDYGYCYVWGAQCEEAASASSYIFTSGSSAIRNRDVCDQSGDTTLWKNINREGSWFFNIKPVNDGVPFKAITISNSDTSSRIMLRQNDDYDIRFYLLVSGIDKVSLDASVDPNLDWHKIAIRWKQDNVQVYINGVLKSSTTSADLNGGLDYEELSFDNSGGGQYWDGNVKEMRIWNEYVSEEEIIEITTL
jgi:hypothetical protein